MTHDHVIETLPWLVNGTLAEGERSEVEEHLAGCPDCRAELALTRDAFELYAVHLPPAVLVVYAETPPGDRLTIDGVTVDRRSVDAHLAHCDDCREELEMVRDSRAALGAEEVAPAEGEAVLPFVRRPAETAAAAPGRGWMPVALAASLLLAVVLAGGWWFDSRDGGGAVDDHKAGVEELERDLDEARRQLAAARSADPEAAAAADAEQRVRELEAEVAGLNEATGALREQVARFEAALTGPRENVWYAAPPPLDAGAVRGGEPDADEVEVVPAGVRAYLAMTPDPSRIEGVTEADYRVFAADGEELYSGRLRLFPASALVSAYFGLELSTADLPDGTITVELTAGERPVGRFAFRVES
jgi:hypothetical protein